MRRLSILSQAEAGMEDDGALTQRGPDGASVTVTSRRMPDGGVVLVIGGLTTWQAPPRQQPAVGAEGFRAAPGQQTPAAVVDW